MEEIVVDNTEVPDEDDEEFMDEYEDNVEMVGEEEEDDKSTSLNQINPDSVIDTSSFCFTGHKDAIYCIAIHPLQQSNLFLSGGGDDKAYLWDISNGSNNSSFPIVGNVTSGAVILGAVAADVVLSVP